MTRFSVRDILNATGGRLLKGTNEYPIEGVSIDSRSVNKGGAFFAIKGQTFDGHDFISQAVKNGASCAVVSEAWIKGGLSGVGAALNVIAVKDTIFALGDIARYARDKSNAVVVAVSGSSGKTTTKDMIALILNESMSVLKTQGNMNNLIGLPLTLLSIDSRHRAVVAELGVSVPGEMARLSKISAPDVAVITNIGRTHLEGFGSIEVLAKEKISLYGSLKPGGAAVVNLDCHWTRTLSEQYKCEKITFGQTSGANVEIKAFALEKNLKLRVVYALMGKEFTVVLNGPSLSNAHNGAAAIAAVTPLGVSMEAMSKGLESFIAASGRMSVSIFGDFTIIDDTYNANPDSVKAALTTLSLMQGRKVAILGEMSELGAFSIEAHIEIGQAAAISNCGILALIGPNKEATKEGALKGGMKEEKIFLFNNNEEAVYELGSMLKGGDIILVKGSRKARMEQVAEGLKNLIKVKR